MRSLEETNQYIDNDIDIIYKLRGNKLFIKLFKLKTFEKFLILKQNKKYKIY